MDPNSFLITKEGARVIKIYITHYSSQFVCLYVMGEGGGGGGRGKKDCSPSQILH